MVECLEIGVGSSQMFNQPKNPFTYEERKSLIKNALIDEGLSPSQFNIYPIPDVFNFEKWINSILEIVKDFEVIFTNNLWIGRLLQSYGKSMVYGLKFDFTKYNGTKVRELIRSKDTKWKSLVPNSAIPFLESWASTQ